MRRGIAIGVFRDRGLWVVLGVVLGVFDPRRATSRYLDCHGDDDRARRVDDHPVGGSVRSPTSWGLSERGHRDRICLGEDVLRAERNEERVGKIQIGISGNVRDHLDEGLSKQFEWDAGKNCYVATGLDQDKLDLAEGAKALESGKPAYITGGTITTIPTAGRVIRPAASHGPGH